MAFGAAPCFGCWDVSGAREGRRRYHTVRPMSATDLLTSGTLKTLEELLTICVASGGRTALVRVVIQDEYTHDVVIRDGDRWLVYDTT